MLVSSRETHRWIIPKGWPMKGRKPHAAAAREALEEAGLLGRVSKRALGAYAYDKRLRNGAVLPCKVEVFPLEVERQRKRWPEMEERTTRWFAAEEAASFVAEPELAAMIRAFADRLRAEHEEPAGAERGIAVAPAFAVRSMPLPAT